VTHADAQALREISLALGSHLRDNAYVGRPLLAIASRIEAALDAAPAGDVVAWRVTDEGQSWITEDRGDAGFARSNGAHVRPLIYGDSQPAPAAQGGWRVMQFTGSFKTSRNERWEVYDPSGNGGAVYDGDVLNSEVRALLDALATAQQPVAVGEVAAAIQRDIDDHGKAEIRQVELDALCANRRPMAVDGAMVERGCRGICEAHGWDADEPVTYSGTKKLARNPDGSTVPQWRMHEHDVRAALTAALRSGSQEGQP
jgi:hypothetical protein